MIIRVDDVSPNTDIENLNRASEYLHNELDCKVIYCVNILSKQANGSVYPDLPMRGRGLDYFMNVDTVLSPFRCPPFVQLASHGLLHMEHGLAGRQVQELSILVSCNILKTKMFVPPFMSANDDTIDICSKNGIEVVGGSDWKSAETHPFDGSEKWYFHHWRMNYEQIKEWVNVGKINV